MLQAWVPWLAPIAGATFYGLAMRGIATSSSAALQGLLGIVSLAFLFCVPFAMGFLCVRWLPTKRLWVALITSVLPCWFGLVIAAVMGWEGSICIVMSMPLLMLWSFLGGLLAFRLREKKSRREATLSVLALPLFVGLVEGRFDAPREPRVVHSSIEIAGSPEIVWSHIERVPAIQPAELKPSLATRLGFPTPIEATLDHEGVGGVRRATFAGGVLFLETITEWDEPRRLSFAIDAQTETIPPATLDEHVMIGGPYFDVLQGTYSIEQVSEGRVVLHLESRLRVSTTLNLYANPWADALMGSIQEQILRVVKNRCEKSAR